MIRVEHSVVNPHGGEASEVERVSYEAMLPILNERCVAIESDERTRVDGYCSVASAYANSSNWAVWFSPNGQVSLTASSEQCKDEIATKLLKLVQMTKEDGSPLLSHGDDYLKVSISSRTRGVQEGDYTYVFNKKWVRLIQMDMVGAVIRSKETQHYRGILEALRQPSA